ncbi:MAG: GNAT family N-acetyltransferase [Endozoicomonas sp.]
MIRPAAEADAEEITRIYNHFILNSTATFEETPLTASEIIQRTDKVQNLGLPWLVAEEDGRVIGYAYATRWNERCSYRDTVEASVYLSHDLKSRGWGTKLYEALFNQLREKSLYVVIGGIALPNPASIALHEKMGMEKVAHFKNVGYKFDRRIDVGYWQMEL